MKKIITMSVRLVATLLLLSWLTNADQNEPWKNYSIHLIEENLEGKTLFDPREDSPTLVFGNCHENRCTFFREREISDERINLRSCSFDFFEGEVVELYPFGSKDVIFMYEVDVNKRFGIIDMSGCKFNLAKIDENMQMMYARLITSNDKKFEIAVNNYGGNAMCRKKECLMSFRRDGLEYRGLKEWIEGGDYRTVATLNEGGYIVVDGNITTRSVAVYTVDDNGKKTILLNYTSQLIPPVSTTHNFVTTCGSKDTHLTCHQFDKNGKDMFVTPLKYKNVTQAKLFNLPNGGFVLLTSRCARTVGNCEEPISHFDVTKVTKAESKGKIEGRFRVEKFMDDLYFDLNRVYFFLKNDGNELCFSTVVKRFMTKNDKQIVEIFCRNNNFSLLNSNDGDIH